MKKNIIKGLITLSGLFLILNASSSWAASCGSVEMTAEAGSSGSISCQAYGDGNIKIKNGSIDVSSISGGSLPADNTVLAELQGSGTSGDFDLSNGDFTIGANVWNEWSSIYAAIKNGNSSSGGGWGLFLLTEVIDKGTYKTKILGVPVTSISHYLVIGGTPKSPPVAETPIPAAVWLFGSGLIGIVGFSRKKRLS